MEPQYSFGHKFLPVGESLAYSWKKLDDLKSVPICFFLVTLESKLWVRWMVFVNVTMAFWISKSKMTDSFVPNKVLQSRNVPIRRFLEQLLHTSLFERQRKYRLPLFVLCTLLCELPTIMRSLVGAAHPQAQFKLMVSSAPEAIKYRKTLK